MAVDVVTDEDVFGIVGVGRAVPAELVITLVVGVARQFRAEDRRVPLVNVLWGVPEFASDVNSQLSRFVVLTVGVRTTRALQCTETQCDGSRCRNPIWTVQKVLLSDPLSKARLLIYSPTPLQKFR